MKKVTTIIIIITVSLFFSCYFDGIRENANDPRSNNYQYYFYTTQWGSYGTGDGQFSGPEGIAVDSVGNVYVADTGNNRVQKFTSNGDYITQWGSFSPYGIAIDSGDNVYVTGSVVSKFTSSGTLLTQWGTGGIYIAIDSNNNIYLIYNYQVQKFTSSGTFITQWGGGGTGNGKFVNSPGCIAIDSNDNIYVSDDLGNLTFRIQKFTSSGVYITQWETGGGSDIYHLTGIAVDSNDHLLVTDWGYIGAGAIDYTQVTIFTLSGAYISQWGSYGIENGQFCFPEGIAADSSGNVYVMDYGNYIHYNPYYTYTNYRIQKFHYRPRP
jgi:tripartite motif-containing protein 71